MKKFLLKSVIVFSLSLGITVFLYLHNLSAALWLPKYKRYKYIDSLPASSYKSVQMILAELEESCGKIYLDHLISI